MKILFVSHGLPPKDLGGGEIYTYTLAKALLKLGIEVVVFARTVDLKKRDYSIIRENLEGLIVYRIVNNYNDIFSFFDLFINKHITVHFKKLLQEEKPHIVHYQHLLGLSGELPQISKLFGIPSILTLHDYWYICPRVNCLTPDNLICPGPYCGYNCVACYCSELPKAPSDMSFLERVTSNRQIRAAAKRFLPQSLKDIIKKYFLNKSLLHTNTEKLVEKEPQNSSVVVLPHQISEYFFRYIFLKNQLSLCSRILAPSEYIKNKYEANGIGNITHIPLGIELLPKKPGISQKRNKITVGYVGNISKTKGFSLFIKELSNLKGLGNFVISVHGQVYDREYFKHVMNNIPEGLKKRIKFHGRFERDPGVLKNIYHNMDILVFPSVCEENAPLVVREALSCGVPVIGSNIGGIPEVVIDGKNGLLFNPYVKGDLAEKLELVLRNSERLKQLESGARDTKVVDINDHAVDILNVYKSLL